MIGYSVSPPPRDGLITHGLDAESVVVTASIDGQPGIIGWRAVDRNSIQVDPNLDSDITVRVIAP